ncbi:MAG: flagellar type III secretion system pore protein FliP [Thermoguttaceae bacterium]
MRSRNGSIPVKMTKFHSINFDWILFRLITGLLCCLFIVLLSNSLLSQEATFNNYNPRRLPQNYAERVEPVFWNPETVDSNNAAVNRSAPNDFKRTQFMPEPPILEETAEPESLNLPVPKGILPGVDFLRTPGGLVSTLQIMVILTVITLAPSILIMTTSFVRIMIVLSILRQAIGTNQLPPSQIITALALFLTLLVMTPVWSEVYNESVLPFSERRIGLEVAWEKGERPIRQFMAEQLMRCGNTDDVLVFLRYIKDYNAPEEMTWRNIPWRALLPAFMLSELKTSFLIGFQIYLPFLVLDMVIASVMVSMGMMMLPPVIISLPFKLMLFVLMDGWRLVVVMLLESFEHYVPIATSMLSN